MLQSFSLKQFKSFKNATLHFAPLTVMIGANASGKSNAIEGLRFLSWLAQGQKLASLQYTLNQAEQVIRGFVKDIPWNAGKTFGFSCSTNNTELQLELQRREKDELHIEKEVCYQGGKFLYRTKRPSRGKSFDMQVAYNNFARGGKKPLITVSDQQALFFQMSSMANLRIKQEKARKHISNVAYTFEHYLANVLFLDPKPEQMRKYSFKDEKNISGTGDNLSGVLYNLLRKHPHAKYNEKTLLQLIERMPEQQIQNINFVETPRGEVMVKLKETFGGTNSYVDAGLLSDGTLRVLAAGAALLSAQEHGLVVVEELDNGLHPNRAGKIMNELYNIAKNRKLSILLTTHNPGLLNAIPEEAVPDMTFCYRSPEDGSSKLLRLKDLHNYPELLAQDSLGELLSRGLIERYVKYPDDKHQKTREFMDIIKNI